MHELPTAFCCLLFNLSLPRKMRQVQLSILCAGLALAGCVKSGADIAPVSGHITLDGKPLEFAIVTFQSAGKSSASSGTDKDGRYELMYKRGVVGAPVGPSRVTIMLDAYKAPKGLTIPPSYNSESKLQADVKTGPNVFDYDLKTESQ
jgi:hypothetical protein